MRYDIHICRSAAKGYINHPCSQPVLPVLKYWWYSEIVQFHLVVFQRKLLRTPAVKDIKLKLLLYKQIMTVDL